MYKKIKNTIPMVIFDKEAVCFHIRHPNRQNNIGMTVGEIMELPSWKREWTYGLDFVDEIVKILNDNPCQICPEAYVEIEKRGELNKLVILH